MADNTIQTGTDTIATDDVSTLNGVASSGVKIQRVKVMFGDAASARDVSPTFPLPVEEAGGVTGSMATVSSGTANTSTTLLAADATRRMVLLTNAGTATVLVGIGATAVTTTLYAFALAPGQTYEVPAAVASLEMRFRSAAANVPVNVTSVT